MELLKANYFDTTTGFVVNSATDTAEFVLLADTTFQYVSSGFNNDLTVASMRFNFSETVTISRIALAGINLKEFIIFYNGATANTFALTSTGATTASSWNANSETGLYLQCTPQACTSMTLEMKKTTTANSEKAVGYFVATQEHIDFSRIPSAKNYSPMVIPEEVVHRLSTGDTRIQSVADKWSFDIKLEYITTALRDSLYTIYRLHDGMIFVPFGTTTSWDKVIAPVVWAGPFNFFKHSDNAVGTGFEGSIKLMETTP